MNIHPNMNAPIAYARVTVRTVQSPRDHDDVWGRDGLGRAAEAPNVPGGCPPDEPIVEHAIHYASNNGWSVFPAPPGTKKSHKKAEYSDGRPWGMTTDADEIRRDFKQWPDANVGVVCGEVSGIFVIEADTKEGHDVDGIASLTALEAEFGALPATRQAESPSGSIHHYFRHPGFKIKNSASEIAPGVDVRGDGGMVIAPPSVKPGKGTYRWRNDLAIVDAPQWLLDRILAGKDKPEQPPARPADTRPISERAVATVRPPSSLSAMTNRPYVEAVLRGEYDEVAYARAGKRNDQLNISSLKLGKYVAGSVIDEHEAVDTMMGACDRNGLLNEDGTVQCMATIRSGLDKGKTEPKGIPERKADNNYPETSTPAAPVALSIISAAQWKGRPVVPMVWASENRFPQGDVSILAGDGGQGKTTVAYQLAVSVAADLGDWLGAICTSGKVLIFQAEESENTARRKLEKIAASRSISPDIADLHFCFVDPDKAVLCTAIKDKLVETPTFTALAAAVRQMLPRLVVIDSVAAVYGGNTIDRVQVRAFTGMLRTLAVETNCAIILLDHPSLSGMTNGSGRSGSMDWRNSVRSFLYMSPIENEDGTRGRQIEVMKVNEGAPGEIIKLRWDDGLFALASSLPDYKSAAVNNSADQRYLECLDAVTDQGRHVSNTFSKIYAPTIFAAMPEAKGTTVKAFSAAQERLFSSGQIEVLTRGPVSRQRTYIARKGG